MSEIQAQKLKIQVLFLGESIKKEAYTKPNDISPNFMLILIKFSGEY